MLALVTRTGEIVVTSEKEKHEDRDIMPNEANRKKKRGLKSIQRT